MPKPDGVVLLSSFPQNVTCVPRAAAMAAVKANKARMENFIQAILLGGLHLPRCRRGAKSTNRAKL